MIKFLSELSVNIRNILAILYTAGLIAMLLILFYKGIPETNKAIVYMVLGQFMALGFGAASGFYFGSSKNETDRSKADIDAKNSAVVDQTQITNTTATVKTNDNNAAVVEPAK